MAITENRYTGDGTTTSYSFVFPYIDETDIKVTLDDVLTTAYSLANATTIQFDTAPALDVAIRIYRDTDDSANKATFFAGSAVRSQDLNDNFLQALYLSQEAQTISTSISEGGLTENSITGFHLANDSVGSDQILAGAVDTAELADGAVTTVKLDDLAVTDAKIADATITGSKLANSTVTETKLGNNAVSTIKIQDDAVTSPKIADGTIIEGNLADGAVTSAKILNGTIVNVDVNASAAIAGTKIDPNFGSQNVSTTGTISATGGGEFATLKNPSSASNNITLNADGSTEFNDLTLSGAGVTESGSTAYNVATTGIPSWVKRIHIVINGLTGAGGFGRNASAQLQIGNSSGFVTSGYVYADGSTLTGGTALPLGSNTVAQYGVVTFAKLNTNVWMLSGVTFSAGGVYTTVGGYISFTGPLDRLQIVNAANGNYNVIYDA